MFFAFFNLFDGFGYFRDICRICIATYCNLSRTKPLIPRWLSDFIVCWLLKVVMQIYKKSSNDSSIVEFFMLMCCNIFWIFLDNVPLHAWTYLQTILRLTENTLRTNKFCISLINKVLCSFSGNWISCLMRFVDRSIALSAQYACFCTATACRLSAKVNPLIRLRHVFDGK